ncbi:MAG: hypothetical protein EP343_31285 [Deltaproteobacteria bacterium]|nr:MAG: hypothetical protein EP343_31285 [Deltaproteobacteria bacterium]
MELTTLTELPQFSEHELQQLSEFDLDALMIEDAKSADGLVSVQSAAQEEEGLYAILHLLMCSPLFVWLDANEASLFIKNQLPWHIEGNTLNLRPLWNYLQKEEGIQQEALYAFFEELQEHKLPWTLLMPWSQPAASLDTQLELPQVGTPFEGEVISYELDGLLVDGTSQAHLDEISEWLSESQAELEALPSDPLEQGISIIEGVILSSPMSIWVNAESFRMYLERRLMEYVRGNVLDLEPIYDNLSRIPGSPPGALEVVLSELTRQTLPWRVCLPRHLETVSWMQSSNVVRREVYDSLAPAQEPEPSPTRSRPTTSSAVQAQSASLSKAGTPAEASLPTTSSSILGEAMRAADAAVSEGEYESISVDDLLSDLPDDILKQLEVLLVDPSITEKARSMRGPETEVAKSKPQIQKGREKSSERARPKKKALADTGEFQYSAGLSLKVGLMWLLKQFTRRALLLMGLLLTIVLSFWLNSLANQSHLGHSKTAKMFQRKMPLVQDENIKKAKAKPKARVKVKKKPTSFDGFTDSDFDDNDE